MKNDFYCEECLEEIADSDVFWEERRAYCGQCGSELDLVGDEPDLVDEYAGEHHDKALKQHYDAYKDDDSDVKRTRTRTAVRTKRETGRRTVGNRQTSRASLK